MCLCKSFFVRMCTCQCMRVCACVFLDKANFESSYKILTEMFVKYSFESVKPEGHVGERNRQIAFTPVHVTLEAQLEEEKTGQQSCTEHTVSLISNN